MFPRLPARVLWFAASLVIGLGVAFYLVLGRGAESTIIEQLQYRQQVIARSEANSISTFFQLFSKSVAGLAKSSSILHSDAEAYDILDAFVERWRSTDLVDGVVLTDSDGIVQYSSNVKGTRDVDISLADRDYFLWAKTASEGETIVSRPVISRLGASKGLPIVLVASPVFKNDVFTGAVVAAVELHPLTEHYLSLMKISDNTEVYLINRQGDLMYSNFMPDAVGSNVFESLQKHPFLGSQSLADKFKNAIDSSQEGKLRTAYWGSDSSKLEIKLVAYSPIPLGDRNWLLVVASPIQDALSLVKIAYARQLLMFGLVLVALLTYGILVAKEVGPKQDRGVKKD